ncbi:hypothetical protein GQ85_11025 [Rhodococcus rhodochrous]|nr:hypothetical protein GQ85_11025 [Rhodococcus rhodochrous]
MALDFTAALTRIRAAANDGLLDAAEVIKQDAIDRTPLETGHLRNSASTAVGHLEAAVGFDTDYAVIQHEALDYDHQDGEAKFLENAVIANQRTFAAIVGEAIRRVT